jgi:hypothetical protein
VLINVERVTGLILVAGRTSYAGTLELGFGGRYGRVRNLCVMVLTT